MLSFMGTITKNLTIGLACLGTFVALSPNAAAEKYAAISYNYTSDEVLHERYADAKRHPASLTKVMTLYMLFDKVKSEDLSLNTKMPISTQAAKQPPSKLGLKKGRTITIDSAVSALVNKSANDVAVVIAEYVGGSEKEFAKMMTEKARDLGMGRTIFKNASGLPDNDQITTASDMLILARALLDNHGGFYSRFSERKFQWGKRKYENTNKLLKSSNNGVDGIKTGYIRASGFNLMASAKRGNERVITIILGGRNSKTRNANVEALIDASFTQSNTTKKYRQDLKSHTRISSQAGTAPPLLNGKPFTITEQTRQMLAQLEAQEANDTVVQPRVELASALVLNTLQE